MWTLSTEPSLLSWLLTLPKIARIHLKVSNSLQSVDSSVSLSVAVSLILFWSCCREWFHVSLVKSTFEWQTPLDSTYREVTRVKASRLVRAESQSLEIRATTSGSQCSSSAWFSLISLTVSDSNVFGQDDSKTLQTQTLWRLPYQRWSFNLARSYSLPHAPEW